MLTDRSTKGHPYMLRSVVSFDMFANAASIVGNRELTGGKTSRKSAVVRGKLCKRKIAVETSDTTKDAEEETSKEEDRWALSSVRTIISVGAYHCAVFLQNTISLTQRRA